MADTAAYLVDQRLPAVPYRHWILTVPWTLRYRLSVDRTGRNFTPLEPTS